MEFWPFCMENSIDRERGIWLEIMKKLLNFDQNQSIAFFSKDSGDQFRKIFISIFFWSHSNP
jgi:hypothetical protein